MATEYVLLVLREVPSLNLFRQPQEQLSVCSGQVFVRSFPGTPRGRLEVAGALGPVQRRPCGCSWRFGGA